MSRTILTVIVLFVWAFWGPALLHAQGDSSFVSWKDLGELPSSIGVEGHFAGEHGGALLIGGGKTGAGEISDGVAALVRDADGEAVWHLGFSLAKPTKGAGAVTTPHGLAIVGGAGLEGALAHAFLLRWDSVSGSVELEELPSLPIAGVAPGVSYHDGKILVIGEGNALYQFDLDTAMSGSGQVEWSEGPPLPGPLRQSAVTAVLSDGQDYHLFVMGGQSAGETGLSASYRFGPLGRESRGWEAVNGPPKRLVDACGVSWGRAYLLALGESNGPGGKRSILSYHSITDSWTERGTLPFELSAPVVARWNGEFALIGAEGGYVGSVDRSERWFGWLDYLVLGLYLSGLVGLGAWCSKRNKDTGDYFLAGRRIPAWAAALSLMATSVSSIGFIAIPSKTFATDWLYFIGIATWFVVVPIVTFFFIPVLRRLNVTTAYEYFETRFDVTVRMFAALLFILMQMGRLAIVLYLPALVLSSVIGLNIYLCIAVMGVVSIAYTVLGGMEAVVWTDVVQVFVLFGGALTGVIIALHGTGMGAGEMWETAWGDGKLRMADLRWDYTLAVFWVVIVGNVFTRFSNLTSDQAIVQRYLSTPDTRSAVRALWGDVAVSIPWAFVAFAFGTALYLFYKVNPGLLLPGTEPDAVVPFFIAQQMPTGVAGLIVAAIFAAAMSSLDSTIHSLSTVCVRDFYGRLSKTASEAGQFSLARGLTVFFGLVGTGAAMIIAAYDVKSLWDLFMLVMGLFVGSLSGLFVLGLFLKRSHGRGALVGAISSAAMVYAVSRLTDLHFFLFPVVGVLSCVGIGYVASLILSAPKRETPTAVRSYSV